MLHQFKLSRDARGAQEFSLTEDLNQWFASEAAQGRPAGLLWNELENGHSLQGGSDAENRPKFVGAQAVIEARLVQLYKEGRFKHLVGIGHTKDVLTPLRTEGGTITEGLASKEVLEDKARRDTVLLRINIMRDALDANMHIITAHEQVLDESTFQPVAVPGLEIFKALQASYPNLEERILNNYTRDLAGMTYFMVDANTEQLYIFSIKASQARDNAPLDWGLWFGEIPSNTLDVALDSTKVINNPLTQRALDITRKLHDNGINVRDELTKSFDSKIKNKN